MKTDKLKDLIATYSDVDNGVAQVRGLEGFAEACYNDNSISELIEALKQKSADKTDCENWAIRPKQWRGEIEKALVAKILVDCGDKIPSDDQLARY